MKIYFVRFSPHEGSVGWHAISCNIPWDDPYPNPTVDGGNPAPVDIGSLYHYLDMVLYIPGGAGFLPGSEGIAGTLEPTYGYPAALTHFKPPKFPPETARRCASQKRVERTRIEKSDFDEVISYDFAPIKWQFYVMLTTDVIKTHQIFLHNKSHPFHGGWSFRPETIATKI